MRLNPSDDPARLNYLCHEMDAQKWAKEFVNLYPGFEEDVALGWFANAIMAGYDTAANKLTAENERMQRVVEQACKATDLRLTTIGQMPIGCPGTRHRNADDEVFAGCGALGRTFLAGEVTDYPDLYAHLKREGGNG